MFICYLVRILIRRVQVIEGVPTQKDVPRLFENCGSLGQEPHYGFDSNTHFDIYLLDKNSFEKTKGSYLLQVKLLNGTKIINNNNPSFILTVIRPQE